MARLTAQPSACSAAENRAARQSAVPSWWLAWAAGVGSTAAMYALAGLSGRPPHVLPELSPDRWIGFHPCAAWVYLSFFLFQAVGFYCVPAENRGALVKAFVTCAAIAFEVFMVWPTTLTQPPLPADVGSTLVFVRWVDTPGNCLPSLHAALSAVSAAAVSLGRGWRRRLAAWSWAIAICWSAIATRQHLTVDIAAGCMLGCAVAWMLLKGPSAGAAANYNDIPTDAVRSE